MQTTHKQTYELEEKEAYTVYLYLSITSNHTDGEKIWFQLKSSVDKNKKCDAIQLAFTFLDGVA